MSDPTDQLIDTAVKQAFEIALRGTKWLSGRIKDSDPFHVAIRRYARNVEDRYNSMRVIGMNKPLKLRSIYTRVNILERITAQQWKTIEDLEKAFDRDNRSFGVPRETKTEIQVAKQKQRLMVLGRPGSGKTTLLKYLALQALDGKFDKKLIPIFIALKDLADSSKSLMEFIIEQFDICQLPDAGPIVERILGRGRCILLLDALDEVSKHKSHRIIQEIRDLSNKYDHNHFVLSCRIAAYSYCFERFTDVELADFTDAQIRSFIGNWFGRGTKKAQLCWAKLRENEPIKELASVPLLLTLFCIAFDETMEFPRNIAELYGEAVKALLKKWDDSKDIERDQVYRGLSTTRKESMFARIAAETFTSDQFFIPQRRLEKHIANFIENLPEANQETSEPDSEAILEAIEAQHGIFVERAKGIYSFSHLTLQEYFTAKYIVDNVSEGTLKRLVAMDHLTDDRWRQVILITTGALDEADDFLLMIKRQIDALMTDKQLDGFLKKIQRVAGKADMTLSLPAARVISIYFTLYRALDHAAFHATTFSLEHDLGLALDLARDLVCDLAPARDRDFAFNIAGAFCYGSSLGSARDPDLGLGFALARARARDLVRAGAFDRAHDLVRAVYRARDRAVYRDFDRALDFHHALALDLHSDRHRVLAIHLTRDRRMIKLLQSYLQVNKLLVDCLNTECYISKATRQKILDELLTVPDSPS